MASRKDNKGRVLRKGEVYRPKKDMYSYGYTDPFGKRHFIYSKDLKELRKKEEDLIRNQMDGLDYYVAGSSDLNFAFDRYMATKNDLRVSTRVSYNDVYDRYVRKDFGKLKLSGIKYSDVLFFYNKLVDERGLHIGTIEYVQRLIHPTLEMAVRDSIIRKNPSHGVISDVKKRGNAAEQYVRHALTIEQQRAFLQFLKENALYRKYSPFFTVLVGTGLRIYLIILYRNSVEGSKTE